MAIKDFRVKDGLIVESGDITLSNGNINFSNGYMQTDNIKIDGNTISSTDTDGDINLTPNGTGYVMIDGIRWPNGGDSDGKFLQVDASGHLSWVTIATDLSGDTSPELGGDLVVDGYKIQATGSNDIIFEKDDGAFIFRDIDNTGAEVRIGPNNILFDFATDGGASGGEATLQYVDAGGTSRNFLTIGSDVVSFENRAASGVVDFYANTSTAGGGGRQQVMRIQHNAVQNYKGMWMRNQTPVRFYEGSGNGSEYAAIRAPASLAANYTLTLPVDDGSSNQVLTTNGSGVLSWTAKTTDTNTTYSTSVVDSSGIKLRLTAGGSGSGTDDVKFVGSGATSVARTDASTITISSTDTNTTYSEATSSSDGLMSIAHHDKLDGIESGATADQTNAEIRTAVEAASDSNVFTDADHTKLNNIATNANNYSISSDLLDEDDMASNSATKAASQQSIKAYVNTQVSDLVASAPTALDTLNELAAAINDDASFSTTMSDALGNRLRIDVSNQGLNSTQQGNALTNLGITASLAEINILDDGLAASDIPNLATSKITSGTFADARISESSVTQHQAALSITESQISDLGSYLTAPRTVTVGTSTLDAGETLTLTAGSNITLTESAGSVTIAGSASGLTDIVSDTTPQLGGNLDLQTHSIVTASDNRNITLAPHGTGDVVIQESQDGVAVAPALILDKIHSASPADGDFLGILLYKGRDSGGGEQSYAGLRGKINDVTAGEEDGILEVCVTKGGTFTSIAEFNANNTGSVSALSLKNDTRLNLYEADNGHFVALKAPTLAANYTLTLPVDNGTANQVLTTDGNGVLSWTTVTSSGGGVVSAVANGADNRVATFSSADALNGEANLTFDGSLLAIANTSATGGIGVSMQNNEGKFLAYTDGGHFVIKDFQIDTGGSTDGTDLYPFKIMGGSANNSLVVDNGLVTVGGDLKVSGNDIKSSSGDTVMTLSNDDVTFADNVTITEGNYLYLGGGGSNSFLRDDGANLKIVAKNGFQYMADAQWGSHHFYSFGNTTDTSSKIFSVEYTGNIAKPAQAHDTAGLDWTIRGSDTTAGTTDNIAGGDITIQGGRGKGTGAGGYIYFKVADGGSSGSTLNPVATAMTIADDGNVGIGTTSPTYPLSLEASVDTGLISRFYNSSTTNGQGLLIRAGETGTAARVLQVASRDDTKIMTVNSDGKVGIGTTSPNSLLQISKTSDSTFATTNTLGGAHLLLKTESVTTDAYATLAFDVSTETDDDTIGASIAALRDTSASSTAANHDTNLVFATNDAGDDGNTERMRITHDGKVGIGTTNPSQPLHVIGNAQISSSMYVNQLFTSNNASVKANGSGHLTLGNTNNGIINVGGDGSVSFIEATSNHLVFKTQRDADDIIFSVNAGGTESDGTAVEAMRIHGDTKAVNVVGAFSAATKSFDIEHPTKEGMRLHHGSLEGPEHGVYVRGRLERDSVIELPDYWEGLVDEETITVQLTANKTFQQLYVERIEDNKVYVKEIGNKLINCFYFIQAERKDVDKMKVEY